MTQKKGQFKLINTAGHLDINSAEHFQSGGCRLVKTDHVKCWAGPGEITVAAASTETCDHKALPSRDGGD